ncbi:MAG: TonB-dependent siderophore receptor [Acidobacteriota bacterium]
MFAFRGWRVIFHSNWLRFQGLLGPGLALLVLGAGLAPVAGAQDAAQSKVPAAPKPGQAQPAGSAAAQKAAPVTTTVVVHGELNRDYLPQSVTVGTLDGQPLKNAPLSATVISRDLMENQVARLLSDVVKNDASVEDDYVPVGYYGVYEIRGFPIDLATGLEIDGMTIAGEQDVPLENKDRVEILNGLAGVESGVAAGGGLINFVTKEPALVHDMDLATDQFGTAYGATDLGRFLGSRKQVGMRLNLAAEHIETYMNGTAGWRAVGAGAANWKISDRATLLGNFEYQHKTERDGSGYQLLGGTTLPDIHRISRSTMLGEQAWGPPDTYDVFNTNTRLDVKLWPQWTAFAEASLSHSLIQDNVIYAYGPALDPTSYAPACPNAPAAPAYFFCPDGTYGIYDYRNPNELRIDGVAQAMATGRVKTGAVMQTITLGGELFVRTVQMPGYFSVDNPISPNGVVQDGAVYAYVGSENIYQPNAPVAWGTPDSLEFPVQSAGPRRLWQDSRQSSLVLEDRVQLPLRVQLIAGGRYDALRDHNYSLQATNPHAPATNTDKPVWLPQYATTFRAAQDLTLYANYGALLSLGPQGPWWVADANQFLGPYNTRQFEAGAKYEPGQRILLSGDYFRMRAPFFYPKALALGADCSGNPTTVNAPLCFLSEGSETHNGFELNAQGALTRGLRLSASMAGIRAISQNTGTPAFDNKQVINVPRVRTVVFADVKIPRVAGLYAMPGWGYTSSKEALRDDTVSVSGYNLFDLGARYTPGGEQGRVSFRVYTSNITNKKYWSDTGSSYGDMFIWLGAPAWVRMSAHYTF